MGKNINQIITDLDTAQAAEPALVNLNSGSSSAIYTKLKYIFAFVAVGLYTAWDAVLAQFEALAQSYVIGTRAWYVQLAKNYLSGALVTKANCLEDGTKVILKVAKDVAGQTTNLTSSELSGLITYINLKKVVGTDIDVLSQTADLIDITMSIQYVGTLATVEADVIQAIKDYLDNLLFGSDLSKTLLTDAVLNVTGVVNAYIDVLKADTGLGYVTIAGNIATTDAGYWEVGKAGANDLITLNMYQ